MQMSIRIVGCCWLVCSLWACSDEQANHASATSNQQVSQCKQLVDFYTQGQVVKHTTVNVDQQQVVTLDTEVRSVLGAVMQGSVVCVYRADKTLPVKVQIGQSVFTSPHEIEDLLSFKTLDEHLEGVEAHAH